MSLYPHRYGMVAYKTRRSIHIRQAVESLPGPTQLSKLREELEVSDSRYGKHQVASSLGAIGSSGGLFLRFGVRGSGVGGQGGLP